LCFFSSSEANLNSITMGRFALVLLITLALAGSALAGFRVAPSRARFGGFGTSVLTTTCEGLLDKRNYYLNEAVIYHNITDADQAALLLLEFQITASLCCLNPTVTQYFATHYGGGASLTSPVCGLDFNTYSTPAQACSVGVYHAGTCFSQSTINACYDLTFPNSGLCILNEVNTLVGGIGLNVQPYDAWLAAQTPVCSSNSALTTYRTSEGYCNNVGNVSPPGYPSYVNFAYSGSVNERFAHENPNLPTNPAAYIAAGPNARDVSNKMYTQNQFIPNAVNTNGLTMAWVNFFIHDFMDHANNDWNNPIVVPIPFDDPQYGFLTPYGARFNWFDPEGSYPVMVIPGTAPAVDDPGTPGTFPSRRNAQTAWFDGSQIYGANTATTNLLRSFTGGKLRVGATANGRPLLPFTATPVAHVPNAFQCGDYRCNFHPGLTSMHTLWVREHNNIASILAAQNPTWNDETLFQHARLIVAAEIIQIHTKEWTNQMAQNPADQLVTEYLYTGFGPGNATYNSQNVVPQLGTHIVPEEFTASYKWHTLVNPQLTLRKPNGDAYPGAPVDYVAQFENTDLVRQNGIEPILLGLAIAHGGTVRFHNLSPGLQNIVSPVLAAPYNTLTSQPKCVIVPGLDLGTIDIVRDRERGIPKYNDFRALVGQGALPVASGFDSISDNAQDASTLAELYNWDFSSVDAIVGIHGENLYASQGFGFPITMAAGFVPFVVARAKLDRFYTQDFTPAKYTAWGYNRALTVTFAQILCDNAGICNVPNPAAAFLVWDTTKMSKNTLTPTPIK
jgi:hypothetical protein